jgi:general secretion pathway protein B
VAPSAEPWSPGGPEYVRVWELPLSIRRNLPELKLSIHVFAAEEDHRFVLVNGERFMTGEMITDSVRLVDIRREGAVVDFRDYRFLLEP